MTFELRDYQKQAIDRAFEDWQTRGKKNILLSMATGTGKTATATELVKRKLEKFGKKTIFLAHREELISQAFGAFERARLAPVVEMAGDKAFRSLYNHSVVVASVASLSQHSRLSQYDPEEFNLIVVDECHHATAASYRKIFAHFPKTKVLGLTATPYRADKIGLNNVFETVSFQYPILTGINEGYLCPVESKQVEVVGLALESVKVKNGEFNEDEINNLLLVEENLQAMVKPTLQLAGNRPTICFCNKISHARAITDCFNRLADKKIANLIHGNLEYAERKIALHEYESGEVQFIVNVGVLTEGYDHPPTACIALFRPMKSLGLLAQMVGRGTRLAPGKKDCLVLDFVGASNTVETVNVLDVLDGTVIDAETKKKAQKLADEGLPAAEALAEAKLDIARLKQLNIRMNVEYSQTANGLMDLFGVPSAKGLYGSQPALPYQVEKIKKIDKGLKTGDIERGEADQLLNFYRERVKTGLCTAPQARFLQKRGFENVWEWTYKAANAEISKIAKAEGWGDKR